MRNFLWLLLLVLLAVMSWVLGTKLSSDALGMAIGVIFGVLAGIPAALLVLATSRRGRDDDHPSRRQKKDPYDAPQIIVIGGGQAQPTQPQLQAPANYSGERRPMPPPAHYQPNLTQEVDSDDW